MFKKIFKLKTFWSAFVLAAILSFVVFLNLENIYLTRTDILFIPKNGLSSSAGEDVLSNMENIMHSADFFKGMLKEDPGIVGEEVLELPDNKKKDYWNSKLETEQLENSGILKVETIDKNRYDSHLFNTEAVQRLLNISGVFYDLETELEVRIVDRNIVTQTTDSSKIIILLKSLVLSLILVGAIFYAFLKLFKKKRNRSISWFPTKTPKKESGSFSTVLSSPKNNKDISAPVNKTACAPDNLPIAEEELKTEKKEEAEDGIKTVHEATPEEVKEKLNKLLSGEL